MVDVEGLVFAYPGTSVPAVNGLGSAVGDGEIFGFPGPNGAGKSTTQKVPTGLLSEYRIFIRVTGRELS